MQIRADNAAIKPLFLLALHISKAAIIKNNGNQRQLILNRGAEFLHGKHEAAIAAYLDDFPVHITGHYAKGACITVAQSALVTDADVLTRLIDREAVPGNETYLGNFINENAVSWQLFTDNPNVA